MSSFDTARLLTQIILKGSLPDGRFTDNELLDLAYDSLLAELAPMVMEARQEYYIVSQDVAVGTASSFAIPYRAQNGVLREVKLVWFGSHNDYAGHYPSQSIRKHNLLFKHTSKLLWRNSHS